MIRKTLASAGAVGTSLFVSAAAFAQEAAEAVAPAAEGPIKAPTAEQMAGMVDKGDTAWMLVSSALVLLMSVPALALFYGGLVRTKNMLSVLMQVFMIVSVAALVWVGWGYSLAFTGGSPFIGGLSKAFLAGVSSSTYAATFSNNVYLPEFAFVVFQMTFACITPALIVGAFAERIRFWPLIAFVVAWLTVVYFPVAHMVWGGGFIGSTIGALDLAGGWPCTSTPALPRRPWWRGAGSGGRRSRSSHTTCRWSRSGPGCCGWAGSASTPARGWPPMPSPGSRSSTPRWRRPERCSVGSLSRKRPGRTPTRSSETSPNSGRRSPASPTARSAIPRAIDRHRSAAERMRDRLLTAAQSIEVVEDNAASAAHGADSAVAVASVVPSGCARSRRRAATRPGATRCAALASGS